jgi:Chlorophyll A-B binding protein
MKFHTSAFALVASAQLTAAFMAPSNKRAVSVHKVVSSPDDAVQKEGRSVIQRPIFDPMGLYPASSEERRQGMIQSIEPAQKVSISINDPMGLYPRDSALFIDSFELEKESLVSQNRGLYDPLGLYPVSSPEYQQGKIMALEPIVNVMKPVVDPMNLYSPAKAVKEVDSDVVMSEALPFMAKPAILNGELAGDAGFDPLGFARSKDDLLFLRDAELKHSRIAMLVSFASSQRENVF